MSMSCSFALFSLYTLHARLSREDYSPAAVDVRVERYVSHVGFAGEVGNLVPDLKRPRSDTHTVTQLATTIMTVVVRHYDRGLAHERGDRPRRPEKIGLDGGSDPNSRRRENASIHSRS